MYIQPMTSDNSGTLDTYSIKYYFMLIFKHILAVHDMSRIKYLRAVIPLERKELEAKFNGDVEETVMRVHALFLIS